MFVPLPLRGDEILRIRRMGFSPFGNPVPEGRKNLAQGVCPGSGTQYQKAPEGRKNTESHNFVSFSRKLNYYRMG